MNNSKNSQVYNSNISEGFLNKAAQSVGTNYGIADKTNVIIIFTNMWLLSL